MHQDSSAPADAAKLKKMLDDFKIPAAGEEGCSILCVAGFRFFGRLESRGCDLSFPCLEYLEKSRCVLVFDGSDSLVQRQQ